MDFDKVLKTAISLIPEKPWPTYDGALLDRSEFLSASEVGGCLRKAYFGKHPNNYPAAGFQNNGYAERGNAIEAWVVKLLQPLKEQGYEFKYLGDEQRSFYDEATGQSGTPDGLMTAPGGLHYGLEFKSIDPRTNKGKLPKAQHVRQARQNWMLMESCLGISIEQFILVYFDASNVFDASVHYIEWSDEEYIALLGRAKLLWDAKSPADLEPEGIFTGDCVYCPFTAQCSGYVDQPALLKEAEALTAPFLENLDETALPIEDSHIVEMWLEARSAIKTYTADKDTVDQELRELILDYDGIIKVNGVVLVCQVVPGRMALDKKAAAADGVKLDKYMKQGAPYTIVKVLGDTE